MKPHEIEKHPSLYADKLYYSRKGRKIDTIVLHYISDIWANPTKPFDIEPIIQLMLNVRVSSHYLISRTGRIINLIPDELAAWHAGRSKWGRRIGLNRTSIGIEFIGMEGNIFTPNQYDAGIYLIKQKVEKYGIKENRLLHHWEISPGRKVDPGKYFDHLKIVRGVFPRKPGKPAQPKPGSIIEVPKTRLSTGKESQFYNFIQRISRWINRR